MRDIAFERIADLATVGVELILVVALTLVGLAAEAAGLAGLGTGLDPLSVWYVFMGGLALYAGVYALGYCNLLPQLRG